MTASSISARTADPALPAGVGIIIPALNEAEPLGHLLPILNSLAPTQVVVGDNGSTDDTPMVAVAHGATLAKADRRGYGAACWAGMQALRDEVRIVAFIDADLADDPAMLPAVCLPVAEGRADLVIGWRDPKLREPGAMSWPQLVGNALAVGLIRLGWAHRYADLGPMRALNRAFLEAMGMEDRAFGWTVEMQVKAVELGGRILEVPVSYRRRIGTSKISGTVKGVAWAGYYIITTIGRLYLRRLRPAQSPR